MPVSEATPGATPPGATPDAAAGVRYRPWVLRQLQDHPGTWLTFLYLTLTAIGLTHAFAYHAPFRINFLDYAETSDFLLAALREPRAIALSLLPALIIWLVIRAHRFVHPRSAFYQRYVARREAKYERTYYRALGGRERYWDFMNTALVALYAVSFTMFNGLHEGRLAKTGTAKRVRVQLVTGDERMSAGDSTLFLVGTTTRYLFLYHRGQDSTYVVPSENVAYLAFRPRPPRVGLYTRLWRRVTGQPAAAAAAAADSAAAGATPRSR
jgi:hypothetical protein